jgi:hypothetical protein
MTGSIGGRDLHDLSGHASELTGFDACFFCDLAAG